MFGGGLNSITFSGIWFRSWFCWHSTHNLLSHGYSGPRIKWFSGNANDAKGLFEITIQGNNIIIFMEPKALYGKKWHKILISTFRLGKGEISVRKERTLLSLYGRMLERVLKRLKKWLGTKAIHDVSCWPTYISHDGVIFESVKDW